MNKCHKLVMSSFQLVSLPEFHFQKSGDTDLMVFTAIIKLISALCRSTERLNNPPRSTASEPLPWCQCVQLYVFLAGGKKWGNIRAPVWLLDAALPGVRHVLPSVGVAADLQHILSPFPAESR